MKNNQQKSPVQRAASDPDAPDEPLRLNKALALAGVASRRGADELIARGQVSVNGRVVTELGCKVIPGRDEVAVNGRAITLPARETRAHTYILINKPVHVVSTANDPEGRKTVLDILPANLKEKRLYPVGRLDYFSEGLLLITDDGELTFRLTHPKHHLPKTYEVFLREVPRPEHLETMRRGMILAEGEKLAPVEARLDERDPKLLHLVLRQGINRQIRRMCRDLGLTILKLRRTAIGPLRLGEIPAGQCRPLEPAELLSLKKAVRL